MSKSVTFSKEDIEQIKARGITLEQVISQIEVFKRGFPFVRLNRPCTVGDGIFVVDGGDIERLVSLYMSEALKGRAMKFVPASGAASRMFELLVSFYNRYEEIDEDTISARAKEGDIEHIRFLEFIKGIKKFAFYNDLRAVMLRDGIQLEELIAKGNYKLVLEYILTPKGLNYANLPKGLIKFHCYGDHCRTAFEEHLVEAANYVRDKSNTARIHFTVLVEHLETIKDFLEEVRGFYEEKEGVRYEIGFSIQNPSTDTIAVDLDNRPFRDKDGRLVFRPGGHGALLENLNRLKGDIVFIKNIDNVAPDWLKPQTYLYKKVLGGYLVELQKAIFGYLERLMSGDVTDALINEMFEFARSRLCIVPPDVMEKGLREEKIRFLLSKFNRPLRVCGMVRNQGEPGGGPFWVEDENGELSLQIVESSQVDFSSSVQRSIWESSTHFNPVDIVCGVRDYMGNPFDLTRFVNPNTGFISIKSKDGVRIKALELPGLWNGSMAYWNTVFVEVPLTTFSPVKTVLDLLRREHQPEE